MNNNIINSISGIYDLVSLNELADQFIKLINKESPIVIALYGNLGAGKTTFAKLLIENITGINSASSPTFNIVQYYEGQGFNIAHFDLYRLTSEEELRFIGLSEAIENYITIIEWPDIAENILPSSTIRVYIKFSSETEKRSINISY